VKKNIGAASCSDPEKLMEVKGRDMVTGLPKAVQVSSGEIEQALKDPLAEIIEGVKQTLEKTPPELAADIIDKGIVLSGGASLLEGIDLVLQEVTGIPVVRAEDPLTCVVRGAGMALEDFKKYRRLLTSSSRVG